VAAIAKVAFTGEDRVRDVIRNFNADGFNSLYPKYKGGWPPMFIWGQRREIKKLAKSRSAEHGLPFHLEPGQAGRLPGRGGGGRRHQPRGPAPAAPRGLNRMTALHLAEQQSGRRLFLRWARSTDALTSMFEVGSCSEGFPRLEPALHRYTRTAVVGRSLWRAYPAERTLTAATNTITENQGITHCPDNHCLLCRDSIAGGPIELPGR
jgi:hypothetical protein